MDNGKEYIDTLSAYNPFKEMSVKQLENASRFYRVWRDSHIVPKSSPFEQYKNLYRSHYGEECYTRMEIHFLREYIDRVIGKNKEKRKKIIQTSLYSNEVSMLEYDAKGHVNLLEGIVKDQFTEILCRAWVDEKGVYVDLFGNGEYESTDLYSTKEIHGKKCHVVEVQKLEVHDTLTNEYLFSFLKKIDYQKDGVVTFPEEV